MSLIIVFDQEPAFIFGDDSVAESHVDVPGIEVHFADGSSGITSPFEKLGPSVNAT